MQYYIIRAAECWGSCSRQKGNTDVMSLIPQGLKRLDWPIRLFSLYRGKRKGEGRRAIRPTRGIHTSSIGDREGGGPTIFSQTASRFVMRRMEDAIVFSHRVRRGRMRKSVYSFRLNGLWRRKAEKREREENASFPQRQQLFSGGRKARHVIFSRGKVAIICSWQPASNFPTKKHDIYPSAQGLDAICVLSPRWTIFGTRFQARGSRSPPGARCRGTRRTQGLCLQKLIPLTFSLPKVLISFWGSINIWEIEADVEDRMEKKLLRNFSATLLCHVGNNKKAIINMVGWNVFPFLAVARSSKRPSLLMMCSSSCSPIHKITCIHLVEKKPKTKTVVQGKMLLFPQCSKKEKKSIQLKNALRFSNSTVI